MLKLILIALTALMLNSCGRHITRAEMSTQKTVLYGSYSQQRPLETDEKELFRKVTAAIDGVGYTPQSVATQVVAGTNFRFVCKATTATRKPRTYKAEVIVYKPLPGKGEAHITKITEL